MKERTDYCLSMRLPSGFIKTKIACCDFLFRYKVPAVASQSVWAVISSFMLCARAKDLGKAAIIASAALTDGVDGKQKKSVA